MSDRDLDPSDAQLAAELAGAEPATLTADELARSTGISPVLLEAIEREGLLTPTIVDGERRYTTSDAATVRSGLALLEAGLPLAELLDLARRLDAALDGVAEHAVELFLRFIRDPVRGTTDDEDEAAARLVEAFHRMLPAATDVVGQHFRRLLVTAAQRRIEQEVTS